RPVSGTWEHETSTAVTAHTAKNRKPFIIWINSY
ncbi:MAG: hypothetical protein JWQ25_1471, partial [Daejeonella sp.]|nr:hypothetical protein [Daejeonella sp.]